MEIMGHRPKIWFMRICITMHYSISQATTINKRNSGAKIMINQNGKAKSKQHLEMTSILSQHVGAAAILELNYVCA